jgi:hypothetical protein
MRKINLEDKRWLMQEIIIAISKTHTAKGEALNHMMHRISLGDVTMR